MASMIVKLWGEAYITNIYIYILVNVYKEIWKHTEVYPGARQGHRKGKNWEDEAGFTFSFFLFCAFHHGLFLFNRGNHLTVASGPPSYDFAKDLFALPSELP